MKNKITAKEYPMIFDCIRDFHVDTFRKDHRRGSNFYVQDIVEYTLEDLKKYFPEIQNPEEIAGTWKTSAYIWDDNNGVDDGPTEAVRVNKVEKVVNVVAWEEVI